MNLFNIWCLYDTDHSKFLDKIEFVKFLKKINFATSKSSIEEIFKIVDTDNSGTISYDEFEKYYNSLLNGNELNSIFEEYSLKKEVMKVDQFFKFMKENQKQADFTEIDAIEVCLKLTSSIENKTKDEIKSLIKGQLELTKIKSSLFETQANVLNNVSISLKEFKVFAYDSNLNNAFNNDTIYIEQDMSRPMNDYYISSSHNTYLVAHQWVGESSVDMYTYALAEGYRLVELDCWVMI